MGLQMIVISLVGARAGRAGQPRRRRHDCGLRRRDAIVDLCPDAGDGARRRGQRHGRAEYRRGAVGSGQRDHPRRASSQSLLITGALIVLLTDRRPAGAGAVHGRRQPGAADRPAHPHGGDLELPAVRRDDGAVRHRARQRSGVGAADHPRHRPVPVRLRLHLRDLSLARRRRALDELSGQLVRQPRAGDRLLSARRLEEGADGGRGRPTTTNAPRKPSPTREPGGALNPAG